VWVDNGSERGNVGAGDFIDYRIENVTDWLEWTLEGEE
jgi:hypothetical protein